MGRWWRRKMMSCLIICWVRQEVSLAPVGDILLIHSLYCMNSEPFTGAMHWKCRVFCTRKWEFKASGLSKCSDSEFGCFFCLFFLKWGAKKTTCWLSSSEESHAVNPWRGHFPEIVSLALTAPCWPRAAAFRTWISWLSCVLIFILRFIDADFIRTGLYMSWWGKVLAEHVNARHPRAVFFFSFFYCRLVFIISLLQFYSSSFGILHLIW